MGNIRIVLGFGWHYLHRYWVRLLAGVILGTLFGLSNASFVWATRTLMDRFEPATALPAQALPSGSPESEAGADAAPALVPT